MNKRVSAVSLMLAALLCAAPAFANGASGPNGRPTRAQIESAKGLWMWCDVSKDGRKWRVLATNTMGSAYKCDFKCTLRTAKGPASRMACSANVPVAARDMLVCGGRSHGHNWTGIADAGAHSCR